MSNRGRLGGLWAVAIIVWGIAVLLGVFVAAPLFFGGATNRSLSYADNLTVNLTVRPLASVDRQNPRPGLRRWIAPNTMTGESTRWQEAWASIHFDGSVTLAAAVGAHPKRDGFYEGWRISSMAIEAAVADLMGLIGAVGERIGAVDYEVRVGIEWTGTDPLVLHYKQHIDLDTEAGVIPIHHYTPVEATVEVRDSNEDYLQQVRLLALDAINQGGVTDLRLIKPSAN